MTTKNKNWDRPVRDLTELELKEAMKEAHDELGLGVAVRELKDRVDELDVRQQKSNLYGDGGRRPVDAVQGNGPFLPLEKKLAPHFAASTKANPDAADPSKVRFGALVAAIAGGEQVRKQLEPDEQKSLAESTGPTGGYLIPEAIGSIFIDAVRPQTRVLQAGAFSYPMVEGPVVKLPGWDELIEASWRGEGGPFAGSQPSFRKVTLSAKTLGVYVDLTIELLQDAGRDLTAVSSIVENEMSRAIGQGVDLAALHGAGSDDEPLGLYNNPLVTSTKFSGANGGTPTDYGFLLDAMYGVESANFTPQALVWNPRTANTLRKLATGLSGDKTQLRMPAEVAALARFATNQVSNTLTTGSSTNCSAAFVGDWSNLVIGYRPSVGINTLRDPYTQMGDKGAVRIYAWIRADVAVLQPAAFQIVQGLRP